MLAVCHCSSMQHLIRSVVRENGVQLLTLHANDLFLTVSHNWNITTSFLTFVSPKSKRSCQTLYDSCRYDVTSVNFVRGSDTFQQFLSAYVGTWQFVHHSLSLLSELLDCSIQSPWHTCDLSILARTQVQRTAQPALDTALDVLIKEMHHWSPLPPSTTRKPPFSYILFVMLLKSISTPGCTYGFTNTAT